MTKLEYFKAWATDRHPHMPQDTMEQNGEPFFYHDMLQMAWRAFQYGSSGIRPTTTMENGKLNKAEFKKDNPETIVDRLRGIYPIPVEGVYKTSPVMHEAAREIERLRKDVERYQWLRDKESPVAAMHHLQHAPNECDSRIDASIAAGRLKAAM